MQILMLTFWQKLGMIVGEMLLHCYTGNRSRDSLPNYFSTELLIPYVGYQLISNVFKKLYKR